MLKITILILLFFLGLFVYSRRETWKPSMSTTFYNPSSLEGMTNQNIDGTRGDCPNLLVQTGSKFYLYNKNQPEVEGENPFVFDNLEQYTTYINKQRMLGKNCPVLYVQQTMGAQGDNVYKVRATPDDPQGGMPPPTPSAQATDLPTSANFPQTPYDQKVYMDNLAQSLANNLSVSQAKNVDKLELTKSVLAQTPNGCPSNIDNIKPLEVKGRTADPMTTNWGGPKFSQELIDQGYYAGNEVFIAVP
jgi:hypothetical protein